MRPCRSGVAIKCRICANGNICERRLQYAFASHRQMHGVTVYMNVYTSDFVHLAYGIDASTEGEAAASEQWARDENLANILVAVP